VCMIRMRAASRSARIAGSVGPMCPPRRPMRSAARVNVSATLRQPLVAGAVAGPSPPGLVAVYRLAHRLQSRHGDAVDGARGTSDGLGKGGPEFGGGLDDLAPGVEHRRRVLPCGVHEALAGGEVGIKEELADAALVLSLHGVASRTRSQIATTNIEIPAGWSRTGMARVSSSAKRSSCAMSSCVGGCPSRSNTVQLELQRCSLLACPVLVGGSPSRTGGCRIWCR
jgi:hypothetical protein